MVKLGREDEAEPMAMIGMVILSVGEISDGMVAKSVSSIAAMATNIPVRATLVSVLNIVDPLRVFCADAASSTSWYYACTVPANTTWWLSNWFVAAPFS